MFLDKEDVWADLKYALDELGNPPRDMRVQGLFAQPEAELCGNLFQTSPFYLAYSKAKSRADARNAHEAIEKGLKAILLDGGMPERQVRSRGHELHKLLSDVQQYNTVAFDALERCYESAVQLIAFVRPYMNIIDYFEEYGSADVFNVNRYVSIEGGDNKYGMIVNIYREIILALLCLISGGTPKDIGSRIDEEARKAVLAQSKLDPAWDAAEWVSRGPVRQRLEVIENLNDKVLLAAVRTCERESKDIGIQSWARRLRQKSISARKKARAERRVGVDRGRHAYPR